MQSPGKDLDKFETLWQTLNGVLKKIRQQSHKVLTMLLLEKR